MNRNFDILQLTGVEREYFYYLSLHTQKMFGDVNYFADRFNYDRNSVMDYLVKAYKKGNEEEGNDSNGNA